MSHILSFSAIDWGAASLQEIVQVMNEVLHSPPPWIGTDQIIKFTTSAVAHFRWSDKGEKYAAEWEGYLVMAYVSDQRAQGHWNEIKFMPSPAGRLAPMDDTKDMQTQLMVRQHHHHGTSPYTEPFQSKVYQWANFFFVHCLPHPSTQNQSTVAVACPDG